ncbi:CoA-binding protein [Variovorax sp. J22R24]|uniref:CoA-binding protein n=1 Tax=Variovorax gracilis TaxID=3053502 RepID=UPI0025755348|nr:CoA-binding protein [Variovorax sp. J22R24]MDM0108639.1 CoA-binding protein [Variovorax sp. J22R24]
MDNTANPTALNAEIAPLLKRTRTIAVVGLSPKPHRTSHGVAQYMKSAGYRIIPVNPNASEVFGEKAYPTLTAAAEVEQIDLIDVFRNAEDVPPVIDEAIAIGAPAVWLQLGIRHEAAAAKARAAGLEVVQDRCIMVEHSRLF